MTHLLDHVLTALALVATLLVGLVAAAVVALVSDPVMAAAVTATGAFFVSLVSAVVAYLNHRQGKATKEAVEDPTQQQLLERLLMQVDRLEQWSHEHTAIGRSQIGELRLNMARLTRDVERHWDAGHDTDPQRLP